MVDEITVDLVKYLLKCTETRNALVRIGIDLNDLRVNGQFNDDQLKAFLNDVRQSVATTLYPVPALSAAVVDEG